MERLTVDQVEGDWERALDSAFEAVKFCATSGLVTPAYEKRELVVIEAERCSAAAAAAKPLRVRARTALSSKASATVSSGPARAAARCQARRSGSDVLARARCTRARSENGALW